MTNIDISHIDQAGRHVVSAGQCDDLARSIRYRGGLQRRVRRREGRFMGAGRRHYHHRSDMWHCHHRGRHLLDTEGRR